MQSRICVRATSICEVLFYLRNLYITFALVGQTECKEQNEQKKWILQFDLEPGFSNEGDTAN